MGSVMMKAENIEEVRHLLVEHETAARSLEELRKAPIVKISASYGRGSISVEVDEPLSQIILAAASRQLSEINAKLRELGCEPPQAKAL